MKNLFKRSIALTLVSTLLLDLSGMASAAVYTVSPLTPTTSQMTSLARFRQEALAARFLSARLIFLPFFQSISELWHQHLDLPEPLGVRYSQTKYEENALGPVDPDMRVLEAVYSSAQKHLRAALYDERSKTHLSTESHAMLKNILTFLEAVDFKEILRYDTDEFRDPYQTRMVGVSRSRINNRIRRQIIFNPRMTHILRKLIVENPDRVAAGFLAADIIIDEIPELMLEHPEENFWTRDVDIDEPWAEAFIYKLRSDLWRLLALQYPNDGLKRLKHVFRQLSTDVWHTAYFKLIDYFTETAPVSLSSLISEKQLELWTDLFKPLLEVTYDPFLLFLPMQGLTYKWRWATSQMTKPLSKEKVRMILGLAPSDELRQFEEEGRRFSQTGMKPSKHNPTITVTVKSDLASYTVDVTFTNGGSSILPYVLAVIRKHKANILADFYSEPRETGESIHLVVEREAQLSIEGVVQDIQQLTSVLTSKKTSKNVKEFSVSISLANQPGYLSEFVDLLEKRLGARPQRIRSTHGVTDYGWLEMELTLPERSPKYSGKTPREALMDILQELNTSKRINRFEVSDADTSEETKDAFIKLLQSEEIVQQQDWLSRFLATVPKVFRWGPPENTDVIEWCKKALENARILYAGHVRRSKGNPPHLIHAISVASKVVHYGVRDPVIWIAALLIDAFKLNPSLRDLIRSTFEKDFPNMQHQLLAALDYVTDYKQLDYAEVEKDLTVKATTDLLALKLASMSNSLFTIFEVNREFAIQQIAMRIRYALPLVSWERDIKNEVYQKSRQDFLKILIQRSNALTDEEFYRLYLKEAEDRRIVEEEVKNHINDVLKWMEHNTDSLPLKDIEGSQMLHFKERLETLQSRLATPNHVPLIDLPPSNPSSAHAPDITLYDADPLFLDHLRWPPHETNLSLLRQILSGDPDILKELLLGRPGRVYINYTESFHPEEGRTVYLELRPPLMLSGRSISVLRIKSVRPRANAEGKVPSYPSGLTGSDAFKVSTEPDGRFLKTESIPGPYGTMTPRLAEHEARIMRKLLRSLDGDYPIGWGVMKAHLQDGSPAAFLLVGMTNPDVRLRIEEKSTNSIGFLYAMNRKTGQKISLDQTEAQRIVMSAGKMVHDLHANGFYHGSVYSANLGIDMSHLQVLPRDFETTSEKSNFQPYPGAEQEAALRFLDLWRMEYDLLQAGQDELAADFLRAYFKETSVSETQVEAAVQQMQQRKWVAVWSHFRNPQYALPLWISSKDPNLGAVWKALLEASQNRRPEKGFSTTDFAGALVIGFAVFIRPFEVLMTASGLFVLIHAFKWHKSTALSILRSA